MINNSNYEKGCSICKHKDGITTSKGKNKCRVCFIRSIENDQPCYDFEAKEKEDGRKN